MTSAFAFTLIPILIDIIAVLGLYLLANTGRLSVGHAAFFGIGAYTSAVLSTKLGLLPYASIAIGAVAAGAAGFVFAAVADRLTHWFFAITTLAFSVMVIGLISGVDSLGAATGLYGVPLAVQLPQAAATCAAVLGLVLWIDHSPFGRAMRAVRDCEIGAQALGINPARIRILTFGLGTLLAGFAGGLYAHYLGLVKPGDLSLERSLLYVVYLSIGGIEYWGGAVLGTVLLSALPELLRFSREYRLAMFGLLLTAVMLARPAGLLSGPVRLRRAWRKLRPRPAQAELRTKGS